MLNSYSKDLHFNREHAQLSTFHNRGFRTWLDIKGFIAAMAISFVHAIFAVPAFVFWMLVFEAPPKGEQPLVFGELLMLPQTSEIAVILMISFWFFDLIFFQKWDRYSK